MLKRLLVGFIFLLTLSSVLVVWQMPRIITLIVPLIVAANEDIGLSGIEVSIERINLNEAYLNSLKFRYEDSIVVVGAAEGVRITWDELKILEGVISSLSIDSLELEYYKDESIEEKPSLAKRKLLSQVIDPVFMLLEEPLGKRLPIQDLLIDQLDIYQNAQQGGRKQVLNGNLTLRDELGDVNLTTLFQTDIAGETKLELNGSQLGAYSMVVKATDDKELFSINTSMLGQQLHVVGELNQVAFDNFAIPALDNFKRLAVTPISFEGDLVRGVKSPGEPYKVNGNFTVNVNNIDLLEVNSNDMSSRFSISAVEAEAMAIMVAGDATARSIQSDGANFQGLMLAFHLLIQPESTSVFSLDLMLDETSMLDGISTKGVSVDVSGELEVDSQVVIGISQFDMLVGQPSILMSSGFSVLANSINLFLPNGIEQQNISIEDGWLRSESEIVVDAVGLDLGATVDLMDITARVNEIAYPILEQGEPIIDGRMLIEQVSMQTEGIPLKFGNIEQNFRLSGEKLTINGTIHDNVRSIDISSDTVFDLTSSELESSFQVENIVIDSADLFADLFNTYDLPIAIVTGQIESSFHLDWNVDESWSEMSVDGDIVLSDIGGAYGEYFYSGLNSSFKGAVFPRIVSSGENILTIDQMDVGLAINDFKSVMSFAPNAENSGVELTLFSALGGALGGYIAIRPVVINTANDRHEMSMLMIGLDVATLIREQSVEEVVATGTLSGEVPILIDAAGLSVVDGRVYAAEPGGKIQYKGDIEALSIAAGPAGFVFEALQDFNYSSMNIFPEYTPDGTLTMRLEIRGNNPEVEQGRPINFNINLEQNLLKLRESVRYTDGLNDEIDEKVRAFYQDTSGQ